MSRMKAGARHRRPSRKGFVRLAVHIRKQDALLIRGLVEALDDPRREAETRALLREWFGAGVTTGFKALLASAPLQGVDLSREPDLG